MYPLEDTRVLHTHQAWQVLAQRYEVMWRDGSAVHLHPVLHQGVPATFVRAMLVAGHWLLTDVRHHGADIEADILRLQPRDTPGVVFYTLRGAYRTAQAFVAQASLRPVATWPHADACTRPAPQQQHAPALRLVA
jgi:hypothetical protein